jgi:cobalamin biosynthesis Co2+ chelatase CbiK
MVKIIQKIKTYSFNSAKYKKLVLIYNILGKFVEEIISKINSYNDADNSLSTFKPLLGLYDKIMNSNAVNGKDYQNLLEKIFANIEFILQKILNGIVLLDASNNFDEFLLW